MKHILFGKLSVVYLLILISATTTLFADDLFLCSPQAPASNQSCSKWNKDIQTTLSRLNSRASFGFIPEVKLIEAPRPNAFALHPDTVVISSGLLNLIAAPEELAFIIAHELGHVLLHPHYSVSSGNRSLSTLSKYEQEADVYAVHLLKKTGFNPKAGIAVLSKLRAYNGILGTKVARLYPTLDLRRAVLIQSINKSYTPKRVVSNSPASKVYVRATNSLTVAPR